MTHNLKLYPAYKPSGMEWFQQIPSHWEMKCLKRLVQVNPIGGRAKKEETVTFLPMEAVSTNGLIDGTRIERRANYPDSLTEFQRRDVILAKITPCFENGKGAYLESLQTGKGVGSTEFHVFRPDKSLLLPGFLYYLVTNGDFRNYATAFMEGSAGQKRVTTPFVSNCKFPIPPKQEQHRIATFLDQKTAEIDEAISKKQRLIDLLKEQKVILINQAVTKGLNPNVPLRDSGVEWIGEVPAHWEVRRGKRTFTPRKELARPNDIQLSATQAYGVIAQADYEKKIGRKIVKILQHLEKRRHVEVDDFVISMRSFQGGLERAWVSGCIRSSYIVLQPATNLVVGYFTYLFKSIGYIKALQGTANFIRDGQDLNFENFCEVDVPFPPIEEQRQIAQTLDYITVDIATAIDRTQHQTTLLQEYRTILIANVVMGKLDVREAVGELED